MSGSDEPNRRVIACDLDDVLSRTNQAVCDWHNETFGTVMTLSDFHYYHYWKNPGWGTPDETMAKVQQFYASSFFRDLAPVPGAKEAIESIKATGYRIEIVTARSENQKAMTVEWLQAFYPNLIDDIHYTGEFTRQPSAAEGGEESKKITKYHICQKISALMLIDDNANHVLTCAVATPAIPCILFGEYEWNKRLSSGSGDVEEMSYAERKAHEKGQDGWWKKEDISVLPVTITRCKNWQDILDKVL